MNKEIKKGLIHILILLTAIMLLNSIAVRASSFLEEYIFIPLQVFRCWLFRFIPFSVGDIFYLFLALAIVFFTVKTLKKIRSFNKSDFFIGILKTTKVILIFNFILLLFWGVKYEQPKLAERLALSTDSISRQDLIAFDSLLISRLNVLTQSYEVINLKHINTISAEEYKRKETPMQVFSKETLLGNGLAYFGIEGYYNPFTGEAQVNKQNPDFMQPFVVAHEMAHQLGIAAEDDANLLAYIRCVESGNKSFQYSAYLNIWLYTQRRVRGIDSNKANELKAGLNNFTLSQIDTLRQQRIKYHNIMDDVSSFIFDTYLKMGNQKDGIGSYKNVAYSALAWERKKQMIP